MCIEGDDFSLQSMEWIKTLALMTSLFRIYAQFVINSLTKQPYSVEVCLAGGAARIAFYNLPVVFSNPKRIE